MKWEEFVALPENERNSVFQSLNPYENPPLFEAVRLAFLEAHPEFGPPHEVVVGEVGGLGPMNGLAVKVAGTVKLRVPTQFMGLYVGKAVRVGDGWKRAR
jgi:hypothetical protein